MSTGLHSELPRRSDKIMMLSFCHPSSFCRSEKAEGRLRRLKRHSRDAGREGGGHERGENVHLAATPFLGVPPAALCGPHDALFPAVLWDQRCTLNLPTPILLKKTFRFKFYGPHY